MTDETKSLLPVPIDHVPAELDGAHDRRMAATVGIIVNGRRHVVGASAIDHAALVKLAFPVTGSASFAVTFRGGPVEQPTGFLVPGHGTKLIEDQVFHVAAAVQS